MSAANLRCEAVAVGIGLRVEGDDLALQDQGPPPAALLVSLARYEPEIVALLWPGRDGWLAEDWQAFFDERAGIAKFDGGLTRLVADAESWKGTIAEWWRTESFPRSTCKRAK